MRRRKDLRGFVQLAVKLPEPVASKFRVQAATERVTLYVLFERIFDLYLRERRRKQPLNQKNLTQRGSPLNGFRSNSNH